MIVFILAQAGLAFALFFVATAAQFVPPSSQIQDLVTRDPLTDVDDFSWIQTWSAVGDSFTAGIGSGKLLSDDPSDVKCSRYDYSYPAIMNRFFGPSVTSFTYTACSGAVTPDISSQIDALPHGQDLVVLTAGGNDLCLTSIIKTCILNAVSSDSACDTAISAATATLNNFLNNDIDDLLTSLDAKMNKNGIVVFSLYAQFFNDQSDGHCLLEDWCFPIAGTFRSLVLTRTRRAKYNNFVLAVNKVLKTAVISAGGSSRPRVGTYVYSDWDPWLPVVNGHFCEDGGTPFPSDPENANVHFFKLNTPPATVGPGKGRARRDMYGMESYNETDVAIGDGFGESFYMDRAMETVANTSLENRATSPPTCAKGIFSLPDSIGKIFHPNELGHETMASFATNAIRVARAKILGLPDPSCEIVDSLTCYQKKGSNAYASAFALYSNTADFCSSAAANAPPHLSDWSYTKTYDVGTPDENYFTVQLLPGALGFSQDACNSAVNKLLDGCDGGDPANPLNWKFGGENVQSLYKYTIGIHRHNRPFPFPPRPIQSCHGQYYGVLSAYDIYGHGWASWDNGDSLAANISSCIGGGLSKFHFEYYDDPNTSPTDTNDNVRPIGGWEWHASFHTPIWVSARCFDNYKVQGGAGGPTDSVKGENGCTGSG